MENFTMLCFAAAVESLRIANRTAGKELYSWKIMSETGEEATCSNGCVFRVDSALAELDRDDTIMLCGGVDVQKATTKRILNWVRREARRGVTIAGLCTAGYSMARAGLLDGKKATIHWENQDSFSEEFEEVELTKSVFVVDGNRITTAGGTASIDLMIKLIADDHGEDLDVTRRIERGAGSAYRVNGSDVRAKDVSLTFADAATGAHSPALVSQGKIAQVIAAKPAERRQMLEEAAGIAGLHVRRRDAESKLRSTEKNLERLKI